MERYLKYGDYVMLYSAEDPVKFMTARSVQEGEVFFIESQSPILREDIGSYPNTSELVFAIYPKQYYEASKQFEKFKMRKGTDLDDMMSQQKGEILKRRMEAEKDLNEKKIQSLHGQPITIGSEVQLFHIYSRSFVKATREKNFFDLSINHQLNDNQITQQSTITNKKPELNQKIYSNQINVLTPQSNQVKHSRSGSTLSTQLFTFAVGPTVESHKDMFSLRLSRQVSSSTHFEIRINPYLNFKKEGEKIQYDECVYFYNPKHNSIIQNQGLCEVENTSEGIGGAQENGNNKKKSLFQNQYAHLTNNLRIPFTIEKSKIYKQFYAAHKKSSIHLFGIIFLKSSKYITLPSNYLTKNIAVAVPMKEQILNTFNPNSLSKENNTRDHTTNSQKDNQNKKQFLQILFKQAQLMREQESGNFNSITNGALANIDMQNMSPEEKQMIQEQFLSQQSELNTQTAQNQNQFYKNNNTERIYFGDYVRIKHIKRNDKSTTQLISESNLCGFCPNLLLINDKPHVYHEQHPSSGIFQIVPVDESFFGQPVEFDKQYYGSASFRLRHVNTSRYLKFNRLDNNVVLSETLEKYNSLFKNQPQVPLVKNQSFNRSKNSPRWLNKILGNSGGAGNNSPSIRRSSIRIKQQVEGIAAHKKDITFTTQEAVAMQDDLQDWYSENADLLIESGSREEKYLLEHNSFCIKEEKLKSFIKVNLNDNEATEIVQGNMIEDDDYIKLMFNNLNPLERKYYPLEISSQNGDFFYFTLCKPNEISDLMIMNCHLDQFMNILENPQKCLYSQKFIEKAENNLLNLLMWLCNIHPQDRQKPSLQDLNQPPAHQKQNIFRENGLIELLISIIQLVHQEKLLNNSNMEQNPHIFPFVQTILKLLQNICYKNYANSIYALQWYFLFREIILDENVILDIRFDLFINDLFKITDLNVSYQADFESISSKIQYEDFNINALNLILSFCQYNEYRQKDQEEEMVKTIFNTKENIFRRLVLKPNRTVCIEIDNQGFEYDIDPLLEANEREVWDYSIAVVNLMVELCKANVSLVIDQVEYFYPFNAITQIIQNQALSCSYRSTILTLIKESYMRFDFRDSIASKFPDYIKFRQKNLEIKDQRKITQIVQSRYFSLSDGDFNLKSFIQQEIREMNKLIKSPIQDKELFDLYKLGKIILQMQLFLVERQIYDLKELDEIKTDIQNLLETLISVYENEFKKAKKDDKEKIGGLFVRKGYKIQSAEQTEWIISALQSLEQIEYRKQNELLELLYQSPQTSGYFDSGNNQLQSAEVLEALQEFAKSQIEIEKCETLAKNLIKLLLFNDIQIKALAVQNIYTIYSRNLNFYSSVNIIQPIDGKNFGLYQKFQQIHDQIHHYVINLKYVLSNEEEKKNFYLEQLQKVFDELCDELFISQKQIDEDQIHKNSKNHFFDKEKVNIESNNEADPIIYQDQVKLIKNSGHKLKGMAKSPFKEQKQEPNEEQHQYYHVWGSYYVDLNQIQKYQTLMANMNYHKKLLDLIDFFYSQVPMMKGKEHVKLQISQHCVAILIHFIIKNQQNQDLLLSDNRLSGISQEQEESVKSIAYRIIQNDSAIQQLFFVLLYQIYKNNYAELMNFTSSKSTMKSILLEVMKSLKDKIPDDKTYSIYFFDILKYFFSINGKNITQNILLIIQEISEKIPTFSYVIKTICETISHLPTRNFEDDIQEEIQNKDESDDENNELKDKDGSKNQEKQEKIIRIKFEESACILITFLRTLKEMVKKSSSQIYTFVRGIFSIKQIKEYLSKTQYLYPLKLEYLKFLMETYINSKQMEPQEYLEVSEIVNLLAHELFSFLEMTQKKELYGKLQLYSRFRSIFEEKYGYSSDQLVQVSLLDSFEVYITQGIIPTIKGFVDKISTTPSDNDAKLVDILLEGLKRIHEYWDNTDGYWTQANQEEFNELKKQIGIQAKQFTTPSRQRGSREKTRKNSGKKRTFLGGLFGSPNKDKDKDPKSMQLDFNFADKQDILAKKLKNVKELQDELAVLIQEKGQVNQKIEKQVNSYHINKMKNQKKQQIFNPKIISRCHDLEIDHLVSIIIQMKKEKPEEFRKILQSLIDVLTKYTGKKDEAMGIRLNAMKMLRKISNYKKDQKISDSIQRDLNAMGFLNFLCDVIVEEDDSKMKLEYILGLNNFMEKANLEIQMSFYKYLQDDSSNKFIRTIQNFLKSNFSQFKNYMKNNIGTQNNQGEEQKNFSQIMDSIQENCIQTMELIRLSCENHFSKMQDFLRVQIDSHNDIKTNSINIVTILADIFEKYCKVLNESNLQFGLQILNTLIELIQGPCIENQNILCHTKLLENLEDLISDLNIKSKKFIGSIKNTRLFTRFSRKIFLLLRGLFDANEDPIIIQKITNYVDPQMLIQKMNFTYKQYLNVTSKISSKHQGLIQFLSIMKDESKKQQLLLKQDKAEEDEEGDDSSIQKNDNGGHQRKITKKMDNNIIHMSNQFNASNAAHKRKLATNKLEYSSDVITYMRGDELINEGFDAYILLKNLCFLDSSFNKRYSYYLQNLEMQEEKFKEIRQTLNFYKLNTCSIEIVNSKGNLQKIIFRIPKLMKYFSTTSQEYFMDNCERGSAQEKISSLIDNLSDFHEEMKHFLYLNSKNLFFNLTYLSYFRNLNLFVILIINLFILYEWDQKKDLAEDQQEVISSDINYEAKNFETFIQILQLIMSCLIYIIWLIFQFPLELKKSISNFSEYEEKTFKYTANNQNDIRQQSDAQRKMTKLNRTFRKVLFISNHLVLQSHFVYLLIAIIFSILGISSNPVFFCLLLLDVIDRSVVLRNVIKSITLNSLSLVMTAILGIIIIYIYSMIGYYTPRLKDGFKFAGNNDSMKICTTQIDCFLFFLNFGLRNGGGVADSFTKTKDDSPSYTDFFFYELSFFVVIIIMILNIIFGIIIDTFAELRDMKNFKDNDQKNNCFICNIHRSSFENERINFKKHSQKEHSCWNYLAYIIMLDYKDSNEYDGIEYYVSEKIQKQDMSWFPIGKSLTLQAERQKKNLQGIDQLGMLKQNKQEESLFK